MALANWTFPTDLEIGSNEVHDLTPLSNLTNLVYLDLGWNQITDVHPLVGLVNLRRLWIAGNPLEDLAPLRTLYAQNPNFWVNIDIGVSPPVSIPNPNLAARVRSELRLGANDTVTERAMGGLTFLSASRRQIMDLTGLEHATNLQNLYLNDNSISDITALTNLTRLRYLELRNNQITDVRPLVGLVNLRRLRLAGNPITDTSPLATLLAQNPGPGH